MVGRPRLEDKVISKPIGLKESVWQQVETVAESAGQKRTEWLKEVINNGLQNKNTPPTVENREKETTSEKEETNKGIYISSTQYENYLKLLGESKTQQDNPSTASTSLEECVKRVTTALEEGTLKAREVVPARFIANTPSAPSSPNSAFSLNSKGESTQPSDVQPNFK